LFRRKTGKRNVAGSPGLLIMFRKGNAEGTAWIEPKIVNAPWEQFLESYKNPEAQIQISITQLIGPNELTLTQWEKFLNEELRRVEPKWIAVQEEGDNFTQYVVLLRKLTPNIYELPTGEPYFRYKQTAGAKFRSLKTSIVASLVMMIVAVAILGIAVMWAKNNMENLAKAQTARTVAPKTYDIYLPASYTRDENGYYVLGDQAKLSSIEIISSKGSAKEETNMEELGTASVSTSTGNTTGNSTENATSKTATGNP